ncbi:extensin-like [Asparagus officinalis]|uniref:extensin-like n=1 Tax=Asparagus officinalis TaxID=4686 RepID=UPI00098E365C|nr:extensin-like [Asparagus officinalis]
MKLLALKTLSDISTTVNLLFGFLPVFSSLISLSLSLLLTPYQISYPTSSNSSVFHSLVSRSHTSFSLFSYFTRSHTLSLSSHFLPPSPIFISVSFSPYHHHPACSSDEPPAPLPAPRTQEPEPLLPLTDGTRPTQPLPRIASAELRLAQLRPPHSLLVRPPLSLKRVVAAQPQVRRPSSRDPSLELQAAAPTSSSLLSSSPTNVQTHHHRRLRLTPPTAPHSSRRPPRRRAPPTLTPSTRTASSSRPLSDPDDLPPPAPPHRLQHAPFCTTQPEPDPRCLPRRRPVAVLVPDAAIRPEPAAPSQPLQPSTPSTFSARRSSSSDLSRSTRAQIRPASSTSTRSTKPLDLEEEQIQLGNHQEPENSQQKCLADGAEEEAKA